MVYTEEQLKDCINHGINLAVAKKLKLDFEVRDYQGLEIVIPEKEDNLDECLFDPCNNWNDVMPIAEKYELQIDLRSNTCYHPVCDTAYISTNKNPRRAICEVFLMMDINQ